MTNKYKAESQAAQERRVRYKVCESKRRYDSEEAAAQKGMDAYKCPYCAGWHRTGRFQRLVKKVKRGKK